MNPRLEKIVKTFDLRRLVLQREPVEYSRAKTKQEREDDPESKVYSVRFTQSPHYVPDGGPYYGKVWVTAKALGLTEEPYPEELVFNREKPTAPLYTGLKAVTARSGLSRTACGQFWTNGHMLVEGPLPSPDLPVLGLNVGMIKKTGVPIELNMSVATDGAYQVGPLCFQAALVDFIIRNVKIGSEVTFYLVDDLILTIYSGTQWRAGIMPFKWVKNDAQPEPHRAPKQSKTGVL